MRRKDSGNGQFVKRVPTDLRERLRGMRLDFPVGGEIAPITITAEMQAVRFSLRTNDAREIKQRQAEALAYFESVCANLRADKPVSLSHRQCVALSGELYRAWATDLESPKHTGMAFNVDGTAAFDAEVDLELEAAVYAEEGDKAAALDSADLERQLGPIVDALLLRRGIPHVALETRDLLLGEFRRAFVDGMRSRAGMAQGDYSPDPKSNRFPDWVPHSAPPQVAQRLPVSLRELVTGWWAEATNAGRSPSTRESYESAIMALVAFVGHDDAERVSASDLVRFKAHLVSHINPRTKKPLSAKTIKDSYLAGIRSVFAWAVANGKVRVNPATGVSMKAGRRMRVRDSWFTPEERSALLLQASAAKQGKNEPPQRFAGRRWVPWLCAYTGARVGEMVQLRKQDVRQQEGHWVLAITPEAITVKGGEGREVPIHPHLIEMGFVDFVRNAPDGYLFMWSGNGRSAWRTAKNRMVEIARKVVPDPNIQPNHGWRHTFKTMGLEARLPERVIDAICGHRPRTVGEAYGGVTVSTKAQAIGRFPRYRLKEVA